MPNDDKDSLEEDGMAVSKIPVRAWMVVIEPKPPNIIVFFPPNAYIPKTAVRNVNGHILRWIPVDP